MNLTVNLGEPYEKIIESAIKNGHAGTKTEVLRQALKAYERQLKIDKADEEWAVGEMVRKIVDDVKSGRKKGIKLEDWRKKNSHRLDK